MKTLNLALAAAVSLTTLGLLITSASACQTSTWTKTNGNSFAAIIKGRDCGGNMTVRMTGGFGDTGWMPMFKNGASHFRAQYGDGQVLTDINMMINGANMNANFHHKSATGTSNTQGSYHLTSF